MTAVDTPVKKPRKSNEYRVRASEKANRDGLVSRYIRQHGTYEDCMAYIERDIWPEKWGEPKPAEVKGQKASSNAISPLRVTEIKVKHIRFYFDDFFNDPRLLELEPKQQQQYLYLLAMMMRTGGRIPDNPKLVARNLDITAVAATQLIRRLCDIGLLIRNDTGEKLCTLSSRRLVREYDLAQAACEMYADRARKGGQARHAKE